MQPADARAACRTSSNTARQTHRRRGSAPVHTTEFTPQNDDTIQTTRDGNAQWATSSDLGGASRPPEPPLAPAAGQRLRRAPLARTGNTTHHIALQLTHTHVHTRRAAAERAAAAARATAARATAARTEVRAEARAAAAPLRLWRCSGWPARVAARWEDASWRWCGRRRRWRCR